VEPAGKGENAPRRRKKVKAELDAIPAFDRGIARARDDRVGTAVLERWSPNFGAPLMAIRDHDLDVRLRQTA